MKLTENLIKKLDGFAAAPAEPLENGDNRQAVQNRFNLNLTQAAHDGRAAAKLIALECESDSEYRETILDLEARTCRTCPLKKRRNKK